VIPALAIAVSFSFFLLIPLVPVSIPQTHQTICPVGGVGGGCSFGDGNFSFKGYASLGYLLFGIGGAFRLSGIGGAWQLGPFDIMQNGCYVADNGQELVCTGLVAVLANAR
jgi:hypothetical protein